MIASLFATLFPPTLITIYVKRIEIVKNLSHQKPCFGDHDLVTVQLCLVRPPPRITFCRDWSNYSIEKLCNELSKVDWTNLATTVQAIWDDFETKLIKVVDKLVPMSEFRNKKYNVY